LAENAGIKSADTGNRMHFLIKKIEIKFLEFASKIEKLMRIYIDFQAQLKLADTLKKLSETAGNFRDCACVMNTVPISIGSSNDKIWFRLSSYL
jgi:hypothetical protein